MPDGPVDRCGSCGCPYLIPVLDLGRQPLPQARPGNKDGERYPLRLVECARCTLVQLDYVVPQAELFPPDYPYATGNTAALREHFAGQARMIQRMIGDGDLVVDIGGNDGTMLRALYREFLRADGTKARARPLLVDPADQARKAAAAAITVVQDYFTAQLAAGILAEHGPAKVIVTSNTFGHVPDPNDFLDGVNVLLAADGTLIIDNQDWHNVVQDLQIDTIYHEHLRYYTPLSLSYLLDKHGLLVTSLNRIPMHGGSFRAVARRRAGDLQTRAWGLKTRIRALLVEATGDGAVYGVGAPTRATTLVNWAGIGKYLTCACEIPGSQKIGGFIPGTIVPVVDEQKLFRDQPPSVLLLAWDLAGTLAPALRAKGYEGKILVPLPEPRVLDE